MTIDNTGDAAGLKCSELDRETEMRLYDALPAPMRRALREANNNISAKSGHDLLAAGAPPAMAADLIRIGDADISAQLRYRHYGSPF